MSTVTDSFEAENAEEMFAKLKRNRTEQDAEPSVIQFDQDAANDMAALEGTITVFWGEETLVEDIEQACRSQDADLAQTVQDRVGTASQSELNTELTSEDVKDADVVFDVEYDGQALARNLHLADGDDVGATMLAHDGGEFDESKFAVREHLDDVADSSFDYCIITVPPAQGDVEAAAMNLFGAENDIVNVNDEVNETPYHLVGLAVLTAVDTANGFSDDVLANYVEMKDGEISDEASVDELVETHESLLL